MHYDAILSDCGVKQFFLALHLVSSFEMWGMVLVTDRDNVINNQWKVYLLVFQDLPPKCQRQIQEIPEFLSLWYFPCTISVTWSKLCDFVTVIATCVQNYLVTLWVFDSTDVPL